MASRFAVSCLMLLGLCCMAAAASDGVTGTAALSGLAASNQRLAAMMQQVQQRPAQQSSPPSLLAFLRGVLGAPVALLMPQAPAVPASSATAPPPQQQSQLAASLPASAPAADPAADTAGAETSDGSTGLSDADVDLINRLFSPSDNTGPYKYDSGMPPLQQLLSMDTSAATISADRLRQLAKSTEQISWVGRTYVVGGDALLKLRLSPDLQLVIRDVISNSIAQSADVPASQVLTFAAANVSLSLEFRGVGFGSADSSATADTHPGLAAVRDALSQLAGGFDQRHIAVSFAPLAGPDQSAAAAAAGSAARRMLASLAQQQQGQLLRGAPRQVYARFFNVDPANATSVLGALSKDCTPAAAKDNSTPTTPAGFVPGYEVPPMCEAIFGTQFVKHSVPVSFTALSVTPMEKPQATVSLSVAVALTAAQTSDGITANSTANWLNSTALQNMLHELNLSAQTLPSDYMSVLQLTDALHSERSSSLVNTSNLSGLLSSILALPTPSPAPQPNQGPARGMVVSTGMLAGIIVAAVTSVLALLGVGLLLLLRRPQAVQRAGSGELPSGDANRRRRKRRVYHNKFIPAGLATADGTAASDIASSSQEAAAAARPHLERGDSVTSAVKFEADDAESAESAAAETDDRNQQDVGSSSSCSSGAVAGRQSSSSSESSSRSCRGTGSLAQQRAVELQMLRAAGVSEGSSSVAVAYSAADGGQSMSIMLSDATASSKLCCSRELSSGPLLLVVPWKHGGDAADAADEPDLISRRQQQTQPADADLDQASSAAAVGGSSAPEGVAAVFAAMEAQLAAKQASSSRLAMDGVQPLGQSCWHAGSGSGVNSNSSSRCSLDQRQGAWPAALPHEQQLQQQWQQQLKHAAAASPFAQQQGQEAVHQQCSGGGAMVSPFLLQQQLSRVEEEQQRQSSSGQAVLSPFAAVCHARVSTGSE